MGVEGNKQSGQVLDIPLASSVTEGESESEAILSDEIEKSCSS